jgi:FkbM family methyltransferase
MKSYSEPANRNDLFVLDVLNAKRNGFFVEAGALDGIHVSNTLLLEQDYGWSGLCVEPDPELFEKLCRNRLCACANACLYDQPGEVEFMGSARGWGGVVSHLAESKRDHWGRGQPIRIPAIPLATLLDQHNAPTVIDYLSLDTEGSEYMILKDFPFDRFRFRVMSIEGRSCNDLLTGKGYRLVTNPFNTAAPWEQYFLEPPS